MNGATSTENDRAMALREAQLNDAKAAEQKAAVRRPASKRVNTFEGGIILAFAAVSDILLDYLIIGSIPIIGDIIDGVVWLTIAAWVIMKGLQRPPMFLAAGGIELIPFGDLLPTYMLMVAGIILYNNSPRFRAALGI